MTPEALDTLEITQLLEEVKRKLTSVEENQETIIGHLESLEALLLSAQTIEEVHPDPTIIVNVSAEEVEALVVGMEEDGFSNLGEWVKHTCIKYLSEVG